MTPQTIAIVTLVNGQASSQKGEAAKNSAEGNAQQGFLQFLDKALGRGEKGGLPWNEGLTKGVKTEGDWFESFKNALFTSGVALKDMSLSSDALNGLKKLLLTHGFSQEDVDDFLNGLFDNNAKKTINIPELLYKIGELRGKSKEKSVDFFLEASAVPHLETFLRSLGLEAKQVEGIVNQARVDGGQLSLNAVAQNLKTVVAEIRKGVGADMTQLPAEIAKETLARMGMADEADKLNGPVSLERFVRLVEDKVASLVPYRLSDTEREKQVAGLLKNVSVASEEKETKTVASKHRGIELKGFPLHDLGDKTDNKKGIQGVHDNWNQKNKQGSRDNRTGADTKGEMDIKGIDIKKSAQQETNGDDISAKVEKVVEAVTQRSTQKTTENRSAVTHSAHDNMLGRMSATENMAKQDPRFIPQHVVSQVGKRLGQALKRGENHLRLQLKPPHLGSIQLDVSMKDNGLKIAMVAEHQYVKDLMVSHVNELREALVEQGVELQKIDVEVNQNFGQSMANADRESQRARPLARRMASALREAVDETMGIHTMAHHVSGDGRLDMFA